VVKIGLCSYVDSVLFLIVQVNALLPSNMFLLVIRGLLNHRLPTVRRKAMELLNARLQHQGHFFSSCNREALYSLLTPLLSVMGSIGSVTVKPDLETNQQVAMFSVKLLARHLAPENPSQFKQVKCFYYSVITVHHFIL
jgi:U3 small nucleolar RNA-associated protein 10